MLLKHNAYKMLQCFIMTTEIIIITA